MLKGGKKSSPLKHKFFVKILVAQFFGRNIFGNKL